MVNLPKEFTATKHSGYFWNIETETLFSLNISGELRELKLIYPNQWNNMDLPFYQVSVNGSRRLLDITHLKELKTKDSEITIRTKY